MTSRFQVYYQNNLEKCRQKTRVWASANPERARISRKKAQWKALGIDFTWNQYLALLEQQQFKCAICGISKDSQKHDFAVDHDHKSRKIRGLLCTRCNSIILNAVENHKDLLWKALKYLERTND